MSEVYLVDCDDMISYPSKSSFFSPSENYPEYPWNIETLSHEKNDVYNLVRECFISAELDKANIGKRNWNPLNKWVKSGDTVLLKPNWVENKNKSKEVNDNLECLVTNPSVVRAIIDYVVIALGGKGKIIIGDAPMQGCNLQELFEITGYNELFEFYKKNNLNIEVADLRKYSVDSLYQGVLSKPKYTNKSWGSVNVDLGSYSMHAEKDEMHLFYKVSDYKVSDTYLYHHDGIHKYEVNRIPIEADVIINIPKPKTHRLAGLTGACKNFVGITYEKASLPHRVEGDKAHGGDAYLKKSIWKEWMNHFDEKRTELSIDGKYGQARIYDWMRKACYVIGAGVSGDKFRIGSWYGNDTIWRTTIDLNYLLQFTDKQGRICKTKQRKIVTIADMIVCGQGEGPVGPSPKKLNAIMMSDNNLLFDRAMCEIMGFSTKKLAMFNNQKALTMMGYERRESLENEIICYQRKKIRMIDFVGKEEWIFEPHSCWKGHIEKE